MRACALGCSFGGSKSIIGEEVASGLGGLDGKDEGLHGSLLGELGYGCELLIVGPHCSSFCGSEVLMLRDTIAFGGDPKFHHHAVVQ